MRVAGCVVSQDSDGGCVAAVGGGRPDAPKRGGIYPRPLFGQSPQHFRRIFLFELGPVRPDHDGNALEGGHHDEVQEPIRKLGFCLVVNLCWEPRILERSCDSECGCEPILRISIDHDTNRSAVLTQQLMHRRVGCVHDEWADGWLVVGPQSRLTVAHLHGGDTAGSLECFDQRISKRGVRETGADQNDTVAEWWRA